MKPYYVVQGYNFISHTGFCIYEGEDKSIAINEAKKAANKQVLTYVIDNAGNCIGKYGHGD